MSVNLDSLHLYFTLTVDSHRWYSLIIIITILWLENIVRDGVGSRLHMSKQQLQQQQQQKLICQLLQWDCERKAQWAHVSVRSQLSSCQVNTETSKVEANIVHFGSFCQQTARTFRHRALGPLHPRGLFQLETHHQLTCWGCEGSPGRLPPSDSFSSDRSSVPCANRQFPIELRAPWRAFSPFSWHGELTPEANTAAATAAGDGRCWR